MWIKMKDRQPELGKLVIVKPIGTYARELLTRINDGVWEYYGNGGTFSPTRFDHVEWTDEEVEVKDEVIRWLEKKQRWFVDEMTVHVEKMKELVDRMKGMK